VEIISEVGQVHDGSYGNLLSFVDILCKTKTNTVKLQHHIAEAESSKYEKFRVEFSKQDKSRFDYWKRMEIPLEILGEIKNIVEQSKKAFLCTPFSMKAVDDLEKLNVERYKVGSADINNFPLLEYISDTKKPVILSTGFRIYEAISHAVQIFQSKGCDVTLMHCTSAYPTKLEEVNLQSMKQLQEIYGVKVGLSDHSGSIWPSVFANALGASCSEVHICWDKRQFGPDTSSSLTIEELEELCTATEAWTLLNKENSKVQLDELKGLQKVFSRSIKLRKKKNKGEKLELADLETFKPGSLALSPEQIMKYIGKKFKYSCEEGHLFSGDEFQL
jgi:N-acetylneuraminate synthase